MRQDIERERISSWGSVAHSGAFWRIFGHIRPKLGLTVVGLMFSLGLVRVQPVNAQSPDVVGQWSAVFPMAFRPVHGHLLPSGKVLFWDQERMLTFPISSILLQTV